MNWLVLIVSGVTESVWATALSRSEGFSKLGPSVVFVVGLLLSMAGLAYAMRTLPAGTAYAVWVGIGATLTVCIGMATGTEPVNAAKMVFIAGLIVCIIGLKLVSEGH
ncbi:multidrug efflux SMR transporter [Collinsella sp. An2]|uniref:DMT family transporter n=1 Tax=Collinsella sp. An2 TaxID=1965585 RepID=UPI000B3ABC35|nr:multidrug efflux SMR transporter [Collinsella sp. An2]OUP11110.1 ligand-binding protein SH3 [Collinsella sp. An2]